MAKIGRSQGSAEGPAALWPIKAKSDCTASDGPTRARIAVADYNADLDTRFAPAKLPSDGSEFLEITGLSNEKRARLVP